MARQSRRPAASGIHHITNRGVNRQTVFFDDEGRHEFERRLDEMCARFDVRVLAYCLMGNHFHLLVHAGDDVLSEAIQHTMTKYVRHTNDRLGRDGPLFRSRFYSGPVESDRQLVTAARYIHRNPFDLGPDQSITTYRWSSLGAYLGLRRCPPFLSIDLILGMFNGSRAQLAGFTHDSPDVLANVPITAEDIGHLIGMAVQAQVLTGAGDDSTRSGNERAVALLLLGQAPPGPVRAAVEDLLGEHSPAALRMARSRARRRRGEDPAVQAALTLVLEALPRPREA